MLYLFWKVLHRTRVIPLKEVDLISGIREIDLEEERDRVQDTVQDPQNMWQKLWDSM